MLEQGDVEEVRDVSIGTRLLQMERAGALPMDVLEKRMNEWIARTAATL